MSRRNYRGQYRKHDNDATSFVIVLLFAVAILKVLADAVLSYPAISIVIGIAVACLAVWWLRRAAMSKMERRYRRQMASVVACPGVKSQPILNKEESAIFYGAVSALEALRIKTDEPYRAAQLSRWHLHAQVSMGEILDAQCEGCRRDNARNLLRRCGPCWKAYSAFNAKRVDLVICDNFGKPVLVIEHQGSGHIDRSTPQTERESTLRNEVKKQVLTKVGLPPLETDPYTDRYAAQQLIAARLEDIVRTR